MKSRNHYPLSFLNAACVNIILICLLMTLTSCQNYQFEKIVECENNQFIYESDSEGIQLKSEQKINSGDQIINLDDDDVKQVKLDSSNQPSHKVQCKKWVHSYKLIQKHNLRRSTSNEQLSVNSVPRALQQVNSLSQQISPQVGVVASSSSSNSDKTYLMAIFLDANNLANAIVYNNK